MGASNWNVVQGRLEHWPGRSPAEMLGKPFLLHSCLHFGEAPLDKCLSLLFDEPDFNSGLSSFGKVVVFESFQSRTSSCCHHRSCYISLATPLPTKLGRVFHRPLKINPPTVVRVHPLLTRSPVRCIDGKLQKAALEPSLPSACDAKCAHAARNPIKYLNLVLSSNVEQQRWFSIKFNIKLWQFAQLRI